MLVALILSAIFLASPVVGYWVLASRLPLRIKIRIAVLGVAILVIAPLAIIFLVGD